MRSEDFFLKNTHLYTAKTVSIFFHFSPKIYGEFGTK